MIPLMAICFVALVILILAILDVEKKSNARSETIERRIANCLHHTTRSETTCLEAVTAASNKAKQNLNEEVNRFNDHLVVINSRFETLNKSLGAVNDQRFKMDEQLGKRTEVLEIRQRTLEKRIIGTERTVNVIIHEPPKGKGKSSLLKRAGVTQ